MDVTRLFAKQPPKEDLITLPAIVRDWKWRFGDDGENAHMRDEVVEYCREAPDYRTAADRACRSRRPNGKMHNHQSRVQLLTLLHFRDRLIKHRDQIQSGVRLPHGGDTDPFDWMHDYMKHQLAPPGIGPVTNYDVATRLGAYLSIEPTSLYLHAGVREGWVALCDALGWETVVPPGTARVPREDFPRALIGMPADEVEDFLCTYRDIFADLVA